MNVVQPSRMEPRGCCGCGFRHIPASLRTWIRDPIRLNDTTGRSQNSLCRQLPPTTLGLKSLLVTMPPFQTPANRAEPAPLLLAAPVLTPDKQLRESCGFCLYKPSPFCSLRNMFKYLLNLCLSGCSPQFGSHNTLSFPIMNCYWLFLLTKLRKYITPPPRQGWQEKVQINYPRSGTGHLRWRSDSERTSPATLKTQVTMGKFLETYGLPRSWLNKKYKTDKSYNY